MKIRIVIAVLLFLLPGCNIEKTGGENVSSSANKCIVIGIEGTGIITDEANLRNNNISIGMKLAENDFVKTDAGSSVELQIGHSSIVRIKEKSIVKIARLYKNEDIQNTNLFLKNGKILADPENQTAGSSFEVETDSITAGVRGTEFSVTFDDMREKKIIAIPILINSSKNPNYDYLKLMLRDAICAKLDLSGNFSLVENELADSTMKKITGGGGIYPDMDGLIDIARSVNCDLLIAGKYTVDGNSIGISVVLYDKAGRMISENTKAGNNGIEVYEYIGDICYRLSSDIKREFPDKSITKISVNEGNVICLKKIDIAHIERIKEIDPDLAMQLEKASTVEIKLENGQKLEIPHAEMIEIERRIVSSSVELVEKSESTKYSRTEISGVIRKIENEYLGKIKTIVSSSFKPVIIKSDEKSEIQDKEEFLNIRKMKTGLEKKAKEDQKNGITEKEKKYPFIEDIIIREDEKKYYPHGSFSKNDAETSKTITAVFNRIETGFELDLSGMNTSVVSDNGLLFVTGDKMKSVICIDPLKPGILWTFKDDKINVMNSPAVPYKNEVILSLYDRMLVINSGKLKNEFPVEYGSNFWAFPVIHGDKLYIPVNKGLYSYDGTFRKLQNLPVTYGQLYIDGFENGILISDSTYSGLIKYDPVSEKTDWKSDKMNANVFMAPVICRDFIVAADTAENIYRFGNKGRSSKFDVLNIKAGCLSNMAYNGNKVYFVSRDGYLVTVDVEKFIAADRIVKIENDPNRNKFLSKKLLISGNDLYYASDKGKLFHYDMINGLYEFIESVPGNDLSLVGTPAMIGNSIMALDMKGNLYALNHIFK